MRLEDLPPHVQEQVKKKFALEDAKKNKYNAIKTEVDGITFASKWESEHYASLKLLEKAGVIQDLKLQPRFLLQDGFVYNKHKERKIEYVADFQYVKDGETIVEDTKSPITRDKDSYRLKRKLFLYKYGKDLIFREVLRNETDQS